MKSHESPQVPSQPPSYRRQKKANGKHLAFVVIDGRRLYLGPHGSPESMEAYARAVAQWQAETLNQSEASKEDACICELLSAFRRHAQQYYGQSSGEYGNYKTLIKLIRKLYGRRPIESFSPQDLKVIRGEMIQIGWSRRSINRQIGRIRSLFKWGVSEGLVPVEVHAALGTLAPLRAGKTAASVDASCP